MTSGLGSHLLYMSCTDANILILNGPNLNLLGTREPNIYGNQTLDDICQNLTPLAKEHNYTLGWLQSNSESTLIDTIQEAGSKEVLAIILNAAAYTHTSIGIRDALAAIATPYIEVHLSNIHNREDFRHRSLLAENAIGVITGFKAFSYELGLRAIIAHLANRP